VPLTISGQNEFSFNLSTYAAVDSELSVIFENQEGPGPIDNPYYGKYSSKWDDKGNMDFSDRWQPFYSNAHGTVDYLVTRLSAYTVDEVKAMIDRAQEPFDVSSSSDYIVIFDDRPGTDKFDMMNQPTLDGSEAAVDEFQRLSLPFFADTVQINPPDLTVRITASTLSDLGFNPDAILGYASHGKHSGFTPTYILETLGFGYLNGALFMSYESFNGHSFRFGNRRGQGMIADFIRMGGTGGVGNVKEPFNVGCGDESFMFAEYLGGRNLAEACYKGIRYLSWQEVVVGDPLCKVNVTP